MTREALLRCEDGFTACFAQREEQADLIRFRDDSLPDMYDHNYLILRHPMEDQRLEEYIRSEMDRCRSDGKDYCEVRLDTPPSEALLSKFLPRPKVTQFGMYYAEDSSALRLRSHPDLMVRRAATPEDIEQRKQLEISVYGLSQGDDFLRRKHEVRSKVYLAAQGVDTYLGFVGGQVVGKCDLFIQDGIAMLEDFDVLPAHQRKGYGTAMILALVQEAAQRGASSVLMVADEAETAKEMYQKLGFSFVPGRTLLFFEMGQPAPQGYQLDRTIDLQKDKKSLRAVTLLSLGLLVVFALLGALWTPFGPTWTDLTARGPVGVAVSFAMLFVAGLLYIIGHEAVHGLLMWGFSKTKPFFGFSGMYAYAGSTAFFRKNQYILIALAPVVCWGLLFLALNLLLPAVWFWPVYFLQLFNLSGAAGDLYVSVLLIRAPADVLVQDDGAAMRVYRRS